MWLVVLLSFGLSLTAQASFQIKAQVHDVDHGDGNEESLIFLTTGHVVRQGQNKKDNIQVWEQAKSSKQWFTFTLNGQHEIETYESAHPSSNPQINFKSNFTELYVPTVIESMDLARTYFHEAKYVNKESQCFNRAHIWSYEWFNKHGINSNKTWLFFTRRYIRKFKFEWWFHVSPSVTILENGIKKEKIMDVKYGRSPLNLKMWTDIFMRDDANCPKVETYSDYANFPESGSCYTMRTSMFYYQPVDIESKETWGTAKTNWYDIEVKQAYLEAFDEVI